MRCDAAQCQCGFIGSIATLPIGIPGNCDITPPCILFMLVHIPTGVASAPLGEKRTSNPPSGSLLRIAKQSNSVMDGVSGGRRGGVVIEDGETDRARPNVLYNVTMHPANQIRTTKYVLMDSIEGFLCFFYLGGWVSRKYNPTSRRSQTRSSDIQHDGRSTKQQKAEEQKGVIIF